MNPKIAAGICTFAARTSWLSRALDRGDNAPCGAGGTAAGIRESFGF